MSSALDTTIGDSCAMIRKRGSRYFTSTGAAAILSSCTTPWSFALAREHTGHVRINILSYSAWMWSSEGAGIGFRASGTTTIAPGKERTGRLWVGGLSPLKNWERRSKPAFER
jgi:hypothetical protein